jgi:hypothetical protein
MNAGLNVGLSLIATVISLAFAVVVYRQFLNRRRPYQLVWSLALLIFAIGVFCQFLAELNGWSDLVYRAWYFTGAMLAAAYLGQGTIYLMAPRRIADATMVLITAISLAGLDLVATMPVDLTQAVTPQGVTGNGFDTSLLLFLIPLNTYGTVALVGGALWSVWHFWRRRAWGRRALGTLLIAAGGMTVALGGTANRLGVPGLLYVTELLGVALIFVGYLQTVAPRGPARADAPVPAPPSDASRPTALPS